MSDITPTPTRFIVVGVDGSEASKTALGWAARQAELTGAELRAVMSWQVSAWAYQAQVAMPSDLDLDNASREALDKAINEVLGPNPTITVVPVVVKSAPAPALLDAAEAAELLVVGSRGHGAFTGMLLGSVSEHCVSHASCPVVVIRCPHDQT